MASRRRSKASKRSKKSKRSRKTRGSKSRGSGSKGTAYCMSCRSKHAVVGGHVVKIRGRKMLKGKCKSCNGKVCKFMKA